MKTYLKTLVALSFLSGFGLSAVLTNSEAELLKQTKKQLAEVEKELETASRPLRRDSLEKAKMLLEQEILNLEQKQDVTN